MKNKYEAVDGCVEILLSGSGGGFRTVIDAADFSLVDSHPNLYFARLGSAKQRCYATYGSLESPRGSGLFLHKRILGLPSGNGLRGDHIDGNSLNNRRSNLRIVTPSQNSFNLHPDQRSKLAPRGVFWCKQINRWIARIEHKHRAVGLGSYDDSAEAGRVVEQMVAYLLGERDHPPEIRFRNKSQKGTIGQSLRWLISERQASL